MHFQIETTKLEEKTRLILFFLIKTRLTCKAIKMESEIQTRLAPQGPQIICGTPQTPLILIIK